VEVTNAESSPSMSIRTSACREKRDDRRVKREEKETPMVRRWGRGGEGGSREGR
jgi:hypothetical protein